MKKLTKTHSEQSLISLRSARLQIIKFANFLICVLLFAAACSKSDGNEPPSKVETTYKDWPIKPNIKEGETNYITFYTEHQLQAFIIEAEGEGWFDTNNNGLQQGIVEKTYQFKAKQIFPVEAKGPNVFTFYSNPTEFRLHPTKAKYMDVTHAPALKSLNVEGNELANLNLSQNKNLRWVDVTKNNFSAEAMLAMVKTLPQRVDTEMAKIYLQSLKGETEKNKVTKEVLDVLASKNWIAMYYDKNATASLYNGNPNTPYAEVPQGGYGVYIGGEELTSSNYYYIHKNQFPALEDGKAYYDPINNVLTLEGADISVSYEDGKEKAAISATQTLTIVLRGYNLIATSKVIQTADLRITGTGELHISTKNSEAIYADGTLTIEGAGCKVASSYMIAAKKQIVINQANLKINMNDKEVAALVSLEGITLSKCKVVDPVGATVQRKGPFYSFFKQDGTHCPDLHIVAE